MSQYAAAVYSLANLLRGKARAPCPAGLNLCTQDSAVKLLMLGPSVALDVYTYCGHRHVV